MTTSANKRAGKPTRARLQRQTFVGDVVDENAWSSYESTPDEHFKESGARAVLRRWRAVRAVDPAAWIPANRTFAELRTAAVDLKAVCPWDAAEPPHARPRSDVATTNMIGATNFIFSFLEASSWW